jgi:hypothetical protein
MHIYLAKIPRQQANRKAEEKVYGESTTIIGGSFFLSFNLPDSA